MNAILETILDDDDLRGASAFALQPALESALLATNCRSTGTASLLVTFLSFRFCQPEIGI